MFEESNVQVLNSIFTSNYTVGIGMYTEIPTLYTSHCLFWNNEDDCMENCPGWGSIWTQLELSPGTGILYDNPLFTNEDNWDFVELEITEEQYDVILDFYNETKGCKFDWIGMLLSQFLPCKIKHKKRWYCSEWIAYALRIACVFDWRIIKIYDRKDLSPAALHRLIKQVSGEQESKEI